MNLTWIENARRQFVRLYGEKRGVTVCNAVIPGVMGDFRGMLTKAEPGVPVAEDYRTDDLGVPIHLEGFRDGETCHITRLTVGGTAVDLGAERLTL